MQILQKLRSVWLSVRMTLSYVASDALQGRERVNAEGVLDPPQPNVIWRAAALNFSASGSSQIPAFTALSTALSKAST